jgi:hypothetical protein
VQTAGSAIRDQGHTRRVDGPFRRDDEDRARHRGGGDGQDAARCCRRRETEPPAEALDRSHGRVDVDRERSFEQRVGPEVAQHEMGVGDRGLLALAVARGSGVGAGTLGTHTKRAASVDIGDAAAATADGVHRHSGKGSGRPPMLPASCTEVPSTRHTSARRAAHVERHGARQASKRATSALASTPPAGPENIARAGNFAASSAGMMPRLLRNRRSPAVADASRERRRVAADDRRHRCIEDRGGRSVRIRRTRAAARRCT